MRFRFWFEGLIGLVCLVCILVFGSTGIKSLALLALVPIIMRIKRTKKPDERELQLFYKTNNWTFGLMFIALVLIYQSSDKVILGISFADNWLYLSIIAVLLIRSVTGIIVFNKG